MPPLPLPPPPTSPAHRLPDEVWVSHVVPWLQADDVLRLARVSRRWRQLFSDAALWRALCARRGLRLPLPLTHAKTAFRWHFGGLGFSSLHGHKEPVTSVVYDEHGARLFSGSADGTVRAWSTTAHACDAVWAAPGAEVVALRPASAASGSAFLWTGLMSGTVQLLDTEAGDVVTAIPAHRQPVCALQAAGRVLVTGSSDRTVRLFDLRLNNSDGRPLHMWTQDGSVLSLCALDERRLVTGSRDTTVRFYDLAAGRLVKAEAVGSAVRSICRFGREEVVCGGGYVRGGAMHTFSLRTLNVTGRLNAGNAHLSAVSCLASTPDGHYVVSGSWTPRASLALWDVHTREVARIIYPESDAPYNDVSVGEHSMAVATSLGAVVLSSLGSPPKFTVPAGIASLDEMDVDGVAVVAAAVAADEAIPRGLELPAALAVERVPRPSPWGFA